MNIDIVRTTKEFSDLGDVWNALIKSSASDCVFLTHEWLFTWWKHLSQGRELSIATARDGGKLIGVMPLAKRMPQYTRMMPRIAEFLGSGVIGSDYLDFAIERGREPEVLRAFAQELSRWGLMLQLNQVRSRNCVVAGLAEAFGTGWTASETNINVCPFIDLSNHTWETYLSSLSSSQRYSFNRKMRALQKGFDLRLDVIETDSDALGALDIIVALHRKRWGSRGKSEAFQTPAITSFHREFVSQAARRGWLRLMILNLDNIPTAALYGLHYGSSFYFYQSGIDPAYSKHSVGLVIMGLAIKQAIEEGASEYDLLHGDEEYKFHWARQQRDLGRIEFYPPRARGRIYRRAIQLNRAARQMARSVLYKA